MRTAPPAPSPPVPSVPTPHGDPPRRSASQVARRNVARCRAGVHRRGDAERGSAHTVQACSHLDGRIQVRKDGAPAMRTRVGVRVRPPTLTPRPHPGGFGHATGLTLTPSTPAVSATRAGAERLLFDGSSAHARRRRDAALGRRCRRSNAARRPPRESGPGARLGALVQPRVQVGLQAGEPVHVRFAPGPGGHATARARHAGAATAARCRSHRRCRVRGVLKARAASRPPGAGAGRTPGIVVRVRAAPRTASPRPATPSSRPTIAASLGHGGWHAVCPLGSASSWAACDPHRSTCARLFAAPARRAVASSRAARAGAVERRRECVRWAATRLLPGSHRLASPPASVNRDVRAIASCGSSALPRRGASTHPR